MSIQIPGLTSVVIPETITVHLGSPDEPAENVTIPFIDYVKNVASSELFPTWPENALRANIYAIVSITLNRVFTEWYRSRGYNFDITNSTQFDQAYVHNRGIFDSISNITDQIFDEYIIREGEFIPLFAQFCDGRRVQCPGMLQWGTVELARQGYIPYDILRYYYGDNIGLEEAPVGEIYETYPGTPLELGDSSPYVLLVQIALNTISENFPAIPKIQPVDGNFTESTQVAVEEFQSTFNLPVTGIIDKGTWYRIRSIYVSVTKLAELTSRSIPLSDIPEYTPTPTPAEVVPRVQTVQYFLNVLSAYYASIPAVDINGILGPETRTAIIEFQKTKNLPQTGIVDERTWQTMFDSVAGILRTVPSSAIALPSLIYPGFPLQVGSEGPDVYIIQQYLSYISAVLEGLPPVQPDGIYGPRTEAAVRAFQEFFGIDVTGVVDQYTWNRIVLIYRNLRFGNINQINP